MTEKREISILIPYKMSGGEALVYLQKRSKDAKRLPDYFGFFGGGVEENETPEEALLREVKEELNLDLAQYHYFDHYEFDRSSMDIYAIEVDDNFENQITILEGEYGKWFGKSEWQKEAKLIEKDKIVLRDFYKKLGGK